MDPDDVLFSLREGNTRYVDDMRSSGRAAGSVLPTHRPNAVVIGCSDARVPVERVFDQPAGSLFVVRIAGHVLEPAALASVLFAVRVLGTRLVVVLGHQACGAVQAALADDTPEVFAPLVAPIRNRFAAAGARSPVGEDEAIEVNVGATMSEVDAYLQENRSADADAVMVVGAVKALGTGEVRWIARSTVLK
jgi:carbonic anhydrase